MSIQVVLIPDHTSRGFLQPMAALLNSQQDDFEIQVCTKIPMVSTLHQADMDIDIVEGMDDVARCKVALGLRDKDLLVRFIGAVLSSRAHGLTNLFVAGSKLSEQPPRVTIISTRFIKNELLPADPAYNRQRHALCHLVVCSMLGAFLDMIAHSDRGCLLDFNSSTPNIGRKIDIGYSFCDDCLQHIERHPLGNSISIICGALKASGEGSMLPGVGSKSDVAIPAHPAWLMDLESSSLTIVSLRRAMRATLRGDADLDAFCQNYFSSAYDRFSSGMERTRKLNIFFEQIVDLALIKKRLIEHYLEAG